MTDLGGYLAVLLAAATPWVEVLFVVPAGVAAGLDPVAVGIVAFVGNATPVIAIVILGDRMMRWWARRRDGSVRETKRAERARRLLDRYGIPGLALLGPLVTGAHLAALISTTLRPDPLRLIVWLCGGLAAWTVALAIISATASDLFRG